MTKYVLRKFVPIIMILALIVAIIPIGVGQAASNQYSPFHDVPTSHWALPYIMKTELRGVIAGYGNGLFKPDQTVTQLEAIVMAVRAMGLEKETDNTSNYVDTSAYNLPTTWNAKGFVSVALKHNLIKDSDRLAFRPDAGASRAWTAQLLIRMLGMENELNLNARTNFIDDLYIPDWAKPYVALAVNKEVIAGIANKAGGFDYKPNDAVTRSQLATLISKSDRYMNDVTGQLPIGVIEKLSSDSSQITIVKANNAKAVYSITATTSFFNESYSAINQSQLQIEDAVRFYADDKGNFKYVEKVNPAHYKNLPKIEREDIILGSIVQHFPDQRVLVVKKADNTLFTGTYMQNVTVRNTVLNSTITMNQLQAGDEVELNFSSNVITKINLTKSSQEAILKGIIFAIDIEKGILTLENNGRYTSYIFDDGVSVVYEGIRFATVRDLQIGDEIQLQVENNKLVKITLVKPYRASDFKGNVVAISIADKIITIVTTEMTPTAYRVTDKTEYLIPNVVRPTVADVQVGDQVQFTVDGTNIVKLEVTTRSTDDLIKGQLININTALKLLTIETTAKELKTYKYNDTLEIYIDKNSNGKLSDLFVGDHITLTIDKNDLKRITIHNTIEGEIEAYDKARNTITIKHDGGATIYNLVSSGLDIHLLNNNRPQLDDLKRGMQVIAHMENNQIKRIEVKSSFSTIITSVNVDWDRIEVQDPNKKDGKLRYYIFSSTKLDIQGIDNPKLSNLRANDAVRLDFIGYELTELTYIPSFYGTVTSVNANNNRIDIRSQYESKQITVNSSLDIYSAAGNLMSAANLKFDDFVKVIVVGDRTVMNQAKATDVEFHSITAQSIGYYDSNRSFRNANLDREVQIWKGNTYYMPGDLMSGSKITIYQLDGYVVGVRNN